MVPVGSSPDTTTVPPTNLGQFASPGGRDEDMVCGPKFTKPDGTSVESLLSQDAYGNWFVVIEVAPGTCVSPTPANEPPLADPNGPYLGAAGSPIVFDGTGSSDPDGDPLTYDWEWGDGSSSSDAGATTSHTYAEAGIYAVCLTVDDGDADDTACTSAVVYDPSAGFVTGGGWIDSPAGAYVPDPLLAGKATFGFVSKYNKKGATTPTGQTEFQFHVADLNFHSSSYDWLVVTQGGSNYARFKGSGTINGTGDYRFMLWAGDGDPDTFRIRIWEEDEATAVETDVYDNGFEGSGYETGQPIAGGSIVIHIKKK